MGMARLVNMARGSELTVAERARILGLHEGRIGVRKIADMVNRPHSVGGRVIACNGQGARARPGRPRLLDERAERRVQRTASNRVVSTAEIRSNQNLQASKWTILRCLQRCPHLDHRKKLVKPPLTIAHKQARADWCIPRLLWNEEWRRIIFSDEKSLIWMDLMV